MEYVESPLHTAGAKAVCLEMVEMDGDQDIGLQGSLNGPALVGAELRDVREHRGMRLADIGAKLKIRPEFLQAIEDGDLAALPAPTYAAGFIRSYAELLSLDPDDILRRFRAKGMSRTRSPVLSFPEAAPDRGVPPSAIALLLAVIAVGGYTVWYGRSQRETRIADTVPPVPATLALLAPPKPLPSPAAKKAIVSTPVTAAKLHPGASAPHVFKRKDAGADVVPMLAAQPDGGTKPPIIKKKVLPAPSPALSAPSTLGPALAESVKIAPSPKVSPAQSAAPPQNLAAEIPPPALSLPQAQKPRSSTALAFGSAGTLAGDRASKRPDTVQSPAPPDAAQANIVIVAALRSWVEVRNISGKILFSRVMQPGESWPLPDQPGLTITTGNAGGLELIRNGVPGLPLGPPGSVVHNALITPSGTIVPPPQPLRVRHFVKPPPPRRQHWANPFAIPTTGDQ